jgi:hypothetical protein
MLVRLLIPLLLLSQFAFAQTYDLAESAGQLRLNIAGTKYSMIVPSGYKKSLNFTGFQNDKTGGSILLVEIPGPFDTVIRALTPETFRSERMEFISSDTLIINGENAVLFKLKQPGNGIVYNKMVLVFGDKERTVVVNSITPENSQESEPELREALFSISFNKDQGEDPLDAAPYSVNTEGTGLKVVRYMAGTLFYSEDGKMPTKTATLMVGNSLGATSITDQKTYAEQRLKKLPRGEFLVIRDSKPLTIDNMTGYEIVAFGKSEENKPSLVYMTMLFNSDGGYYIILGNAEENFPAYEEKFRKVALSFKRKP